MRRFSISTRISGFLFLVVLVLIVIYQTSLLTINHRFERLLEHEVKVSFLANKAQQQFLQCRTIERNYLGREEKIDQLDDLQKGELEEWEHHYNQMIFHTNAIYIQGQLSGDDMLLQQAAEMIAQMESYRQSFKEALAVVHQGIDDNFGALGQVKEKALKIETEVRNEDLDTLFIEWLKLRQKESDYLLYRTEEYADRILQALPEFSQAVESSEAAESLTKMLMRSHLRVYNESIQEVIAADAEVQKMLYSLEEEAGQIEPKVAAVVKSLGESVKRQKRESSRHAEAMMLFSVIAGLIALGIVLSLPFYLTYSVIKPVSQLSRSMDEVALKVTAASEQVRDSSVKAHDSAQKQNETLDQITDSLEQLGSSTRDTNSNACSAGQLAEDTASSAQQGNKAIERLEDAMNAIQRSSNETSKILKTIDEIAFQTNLLALNAAVEAARAGDAGSGFAVVADEVRNLARRSAEAARQTESLIEEAIRNAEHGAAVSDEVMEIFGSTLKNAEAMTDLVQNVTMASENQSVSIDSICEHVSSLAKISSYSMREAEQFAHASSEMAVNAGELKNSVKSLLSVIGKRADRQLLLENHLPEHVAVELEDF